MTNRKITVVDYQADWVNKFTDEKALLIQAIGNIALNIEHIGSTSVPGLAAKPIIDILVEVTDLNRLDTKSNEMVALGYNIKGENGISGRRYFQKGDNQRSHHLHAFNQNDPHLMRHRAFRDYLLAHSNVAQQYAKIKTQAAHQCQHDTNMYMALKNDFIQHHETKAINWYQLMAR
ncbi:hypothetical protein tinsulaeT_02290 [Thalassotalea insulae]|uniref:GrpB family protein n=1 Tax=Thalassotalea insulae TaxID=2056778 RepID=A0ABQ6GMR0_9GAMM|nr:GrpB family protein [Thalassotalea insulae]GLX76889.1 hypothetical protein tinsulaeT_02290 [Thalassotalea insulae]